jgi:two-component system sensor histidine kinase HydH
MKISALWKKRIFQPRTLSLAFLGLATLMLLSGLVELHMSKNELMELMEKQAHTVLENLLVASNNSLLINEYMESCLRERLFNNANFIRYLYEKGQINNLLLKQVTEQHDIYRINIFNRKGKKIFHSHKPVHAGLKEKTSPQKTLKPIFEGQRDTLIIGLKEARFELGSRYAVAVAARDHSAIVVNLDAEQLMRFRKKISYGTLVRKLVANPGIIFVALQDTNGILVASGNVRELEGVKESPFLSESLQNSTFGTRITTFGSIQVFEAVHPFYHQGHLVGLFRLGLSLKPMDAIKARLYRRIIFSSLVLFITGAILFTFILVQQNLTTLEKRYQVVETYSSDIIRNVSDAIMVYGRQSGIKIFNQAAERLFNKTEAEVKGQPLSMIWDRSRCEVIVRSAGHMQQIKCKIQNVSRYLLVSKSAFYDQNNNENIILVIRDLTEQKSLEAQVQRTEHLSAMGELASGVAHEIRNPLNAIGTIIQQLDKDFEPESNREEYHQLARLVYKEVRRINETVQDFLRFARPEPFQPQLFQLSDLMDHLFRQYQPLTTVQHLQFTLDQTWDGEVFWDRRQMHQVLINLMQNGLDVLSANGKILIKVADINEKELEIRVHDTGPGIPANIRSKIFNLYFTTKAKGTGIGLSIVQRIIYEHGGIISVESAENLGTTFILRMPKRTYVL